MIKKLLKDLLRKRACFDSEQLLFTVLSYKRDCALVCEKDHIYTLFVIWFTNLFHFIYKTVLTLKTVDI